MGKTQQAALKLAVEAMRKEKHRLAVHANINRLYPNGAPPVMQRDAVKRARYEAALKVLERWIDDIT